MADQHSRYWRGPEAEGLQTRYRSLSEAQETGGTELVPTSAGDTEMAALEVEMADTSGPYWSGPEAEAKQERYRQLLELRDGVPEAEGFDGPAASEIASTFGLSVESAELAQGKVAAISAEMPNLDEVNMAVAGLPDTCRIAVVKEFAQPAASFPAATAEQLTQFRETGAGQLLMQEWGDSAAQRLGVILGRWDRLCSHLSNDDYLMLDDFFRVRLTPAERAGILVVLAG